MLCKFNPGIAARMDAQLDTRVMMYEVCMIVCLANELGPELDEQMCKIRSVPSYIIQEL